MTRTSSTILLNSSTADILQTLSISCLCDGEEETISSAVHNKLIKPFLSFHGKRKAHAGIESISLSSSTISP